MDATTVQAIGVLERNHATTAIEKANLAPHKMLNTTSSKYLFSVFSVLINDTSEADVDRLANRDGGITDQHFSDICKAFPGVKEQAYPALLFTVTLLFLRYSSQAFFGKDYNFPISLRLYASSVLNKIKALNSDLFTQLNGTTLQNALLSDSCTDTLAHQMQTLAKNNADIYSIYEQVIPQMWR